MRSPPELLIVCRNYRVFALNALGTVRTVTSRQFNRKGNTMAARKRITRTARKATSAAGRLTRIRNNAMAAVDSIVKQGTALQARGRKLAMAKAKEARNA